jgi:hypothetical protein
MTRLVAIALVLVGLAAPAFARREFVATPEDFKCLLDGTKAPGKTFYIFGPRRAVVKKAIRKTRLVTKALQAGRTPKLGKGYPVGTILQLFPFEAMAKRGGTFNPEGHGWEYFKIRPNADGTSEIIARGTGDVIGITGSSCQTCHEKLASGHDSVCEFVVGASGLGFTDEQIAAFQASDPRCAK